MWYSFSKRKNYKNPNKLYFKLQPNLESLLEEQREENTELYPENQSMTSSESSRGQIELWRGLFQYKMGKGSPVFSGERSFTETHPMNKME